MDCNADCVIVIVLAVLFGACALITLFAVIGMMSAPGRNDGTIDAFFPEGYRIRLSDGALLPPPNPYGMPGDLAVEPCATPTRRPRSPARRRVTSL